jgi:hypothetical protein
MCVLRTQKSFWKSIDNKLNRRNLIFLNVEFPKRIVALMELTQFEILHLEGLRDTCLLITFSFLIVDTVA